MIHNQPRRPEIESGDDVAIIFKLSILLHQWTRRSETMTSLRVYFQYAPVSITDLDSKALDLCQTELSATAFSKGWRWSQEGDSIQVIPDKEPMNRMTRKVISTEIPTEISATKITNVALDAMLVRTLVRLAGTGERHEA